MGKLLAGKLARRVGPVVSTYTHGVSGSTTPRDLETALQLLYLQFTSPNRDPASFALMKQRLEANLANQAQNPGSVFSERVTVRQHVEPLHLPIAMKLEDIPKLSADRMLRVLSAALRERRRLHVLHGRLLQGG